GAAAVAPHRAAEVRRGRHPGRRARPALRSRVPHPRAFGAHAGHRREPPCRRAGGGAPGVRGDQRRASRMKSQEPYRCGAIAVIGRPNVGKSTLVNALVGEHITITSRKPQTTRHRIRGILTSDEAQYVFVDTPGFQTRHGGALNRMLNRGVRLALEEVDLAMLVVEAAMFTEA